MKKQIKPKTSKLKVFLLCCFVFLVAWLAWYIWYLNCDKIEDKGEWYFETFYENWALESTGHRINWELEWKVYTYFENWNLKWLHTYKNWVFEWRAETYYEKLTIRTWSILSFLRIGLIFYMILWRLNTSSNNVDEKLTVNLRRRYLRWKLRIIIILTYWIIDYKNSLWVLFLIIKNIILVVNIITHKIIKAISGFKYDNDHFISVIYNATNQKIIDLIVAIDLHFDNWTSSWFHDGLIIQSKIENTK